MSRHRRPSIQLATVLTAWTVAVAAASPAFGVASAAVARGGAHSRGQVLAVVGDSIFLGIRADGGAAGLAELTAATSATTWAIHAESGFGWGASAPDWPLSVVVGSWAVRQSTRLTAGRPAALVVELGTNDALRAAFAVARNDARFAARVRAAVATNVGRVLRAAHDRTGCTVLVTASTRPTTLFGAGRLYARQASLVNATIRRVAASSSSARVAVADWGRVSDSHHPGGASAVDWFEPDGVHLTADGQRALVALVQRTATTCGASSAA